ncbi:MAG TPA: class I SAM-dependent RNA methyltransferase [Candidatus Ligilactobacillus excrementigallinarum]|uniref:Class I SAM-dependent RNA methyltransferase n=1 Tax=Candidatus Ligilactobacillus excrementigallinarum TaxID=2838641 RepID=A0A9D2AAM0_9LACO|nr:class I SAM-dependent RNA methyltransferase [Candidatus Ligilactobacillus excrementigallinarum]
MRIMELIATCAAGIEGILGNEMKHLGYSANVENGRVRFQGDFNDVIKTNLWLRTADRIKIVLATFTAKTFDDLFESIKSIAWEDWLSLDATFPVNAKSQKSQLHNVPSVQSISKKAIVERMNQIYHRRTKFPETGAVYPVEVVINKNKVMVLLDTTGSSLFKRGYRLDKGGAPLKENMAAAIVLLSHWYPEYPFVDPTCGSGTIPIEAAMFARNIAPGLKRSFVFENWQQVDSKQVEVARKAARNQIKNGDNLDIAGYDIDGRMINIATVNAKAAGVLSNIKFKQLALKDFKTNKINGVIVANPPYGQRLSDKETVHQIYRQMGNVYRPLTTWSKYILTSDLNFEKYYGQKASKKRKLYNGSLRTDLYQFWGKKKISKGDISEN